jgi:hypothetical protein
VEFDPETRHDSETRRGDPTRPRPDGGGTPERGADESTAPTARTVSRLSTRAAVALQGRAGNRAVARLVAQRRTAAGQQGATARAGGAASPARPGSPGAPATTSAGPTEAAPIEPVQRAADTATRPGPQADPKFAALRRDVKSKQQTLGKHPPPKSEADAAGKAAKPPQDDKEAQGKAANAEKMNAAKPGEFNKAAFIAAVNAAIAKQAPKNLDDADKFGESGKADAVKGEVQGKVGDGKKASAGQIESTTKAAPDTAAAKDKPVTPLRPDQAPPKPGTPDPGQAIPDKAPPAATDFSAGPNQVNDEMAGAGVTEEQLAKSNEPEFTGALKEKKAGEQHAATAPGEVRASEAQTLAGAKAQANQAGAAAMTAMTATRGKSGKEVDAGKGGAQSEDEKKRAQVNAKLQTVFDATKRDVEAILTGLDKKVDDQFTKGEKAARDAFTADHKRRMDAYKDKRYSGFTGKLKWVKDKFAGLPEEANQIFVTARQGYVTAMQQVISQVADTIGTELNAAKTRIAKGRTDLKAEVDRLPKDLQQLGKEAASEFAGKFDELTESVDAKGTELVDTLASKYTEALKSVDEEIAAEKEKNKGLITKAIDAVKGVIETIKNLASLLMGVLAKAAHAVAAIIKDPIGFLGKLVSAVGAGLRQFMSKIGEHLQKGLVSWLLGTAAKAGLQLPAKFDLKGILQLIASLLGLTWGAIRGRVVAKGIPEQAMGAVEAGVPVVAKIQSEGIGGLWEDIKDQIGDLKETLIAKVSEYLIPTVLIAGITWIVSLLNPASAFIKACKAIIDIVTFIVERGAQILAFVNSVLDAVIAIAGGGAGGVPGLIETALANSIPVLIGFLAALLGVGGIADKVKKIFQSLSKPVMKAVDWVVGKIAALGKKIWNKLKGKGKKSKDPSKDPAKDRAKAEPLAIRDAEQLLNSSDGKADVQQKLPGISRRHGVPLRLVSEANTAAGERVHIQTMATGSHTLRGGPDDEQRRFVALRASLHDVQAQMELDALRGEMSLRMLLRQLEPLPVAKRESVLIGLYQKRTGGETGLDLDKLKRRYARIKTVLDHAIGLEQQRRLPACVAVLKDMQQLRGQLPPIDDRIVKCRRKHEEDAIRADLNDIMEKLSAVAKGHGYPSVDSLQHPSEFVLDGRIRSAYSDIRQHFYPGTYSGTDAWATRELARLTAAKASHPALSRETGFADPAYFYCRYGNHIVPATSQTFDHVKSVANHWNKTGHKSRQSERDRFFSDTTNLEIICGPCNSSKGSGGEKYQLEVESAFRGRGE